MSDVVRAEYKYGELFLTGDSSTVDRLHALLRAHLGVVAPAPDRAAVRFVTVRADQIPPPARWGKLSLAGLAVGAAVSAVVYVVGRVVVLGWFSRWLA
jgi:hypothetical protein